VSDDLADLAVIQAAVMLAGFRDQFPDDERLVDLASRAWSLCLDKPELLQKLVQNAALTAKETPESARQRQREAQRASSLASLAETQRANREERAIIKKISNELLVASIKEITNGTNGRFDKRADQ
jgi:hypothetical protein